MKSIIESTNIEAEAEDTNLDNYLNTIVETIISREDNRYKNKVGLPKNKADDNPVKIKVLEEDRQKLFKAMKSVGL